MCGCACACACAWAWACGRGCEARESVGANFQHAEAHKLGGFLRLRLPLKTKGGPHPR